MTVLSEKERENYADFIKVKESSIAEEKERLTNNTPYKQNAYFALALNYRSLTLAQFRLDNDSNAFKANARAGVEAILRMYEVSPNEKTAYVGMYEYVNIFWALAASDMPLAQEMARVLDSKTNRNRPHPFARAMAMAVKTAVLQDAAFPEHHAYLLKRCQERKGETGFIGVAQALNALVAKDETALKKAIETFLKAYPRRVGPGKFFDKLGEKHLCVWGVALVNWARLWGMDIKMESKLIPGSLLVANVEEVIACRF